MAYRASIIGCGRVAWMLEDDPLEEKPCTHMGAYLSLGESVVSVVGASDIDTGRLSLFSRRFGVHSVYSDYREMLRAERPDIVSICAYATERFHMVMDSIDAGVKGIWCEKAFATNLGEARALIDACRANDVELIVSHMRRWSGEYQKAKEIIDSGGIGELQYISAHFSGSLLHTGTHAFDVLCWFCGAPASVYGELEKGSVGHHPWDMAGDCGGRALIHFADGSYATVHADSKPYFFFEFDIVGSAGRIRIGNNDCLEYYTPDRSAHYTGIKELKKRPFPEYRHKNIWVEAITDLIGAMEGRGDVRNGPQDGLNAFEIALAIHESSRSGSVVGMPLTESAITVRSR
jgi:predicted dehydrogenase